MQAHTTHTYTSAFSSTHTHGSRVAVGSLSKARTQLTFSSPTSFTHPTTEQQFKKMDGWLGATRENLRNTLMDIASLRAKLKTTKTSADQQRDVFATLQATAHILEMPMDATYIKRKYGICLEAGALPGQLNEASPREVEVEEKEPDEEGEDGL